MYVSSEANAYDKVAYPTQCCPQAHPDRLATLATLLGMSPARAENCRVLELGCGSGGNLVSLAFAFPNSEFVGVDFAATAISEATQSARVLEVPNVEFCCADLLEWSPPDGEFDYVIAHGLISWVPEAVCTKVFEICRDKLSPKGVAYLSYNSLPGFRIRQMLREILLFHTRNVTPPERKIDEAKALLLLLAGDYPTENELAPVVKAEAQRMLNRGFDALLFHDDLAEFNRPFYFHEFMSLAERHSLQYLAEADFHEMQDTVYPAPLVADLHRFGGDYIGSQQYLDFVKCRSFRQTLLCRTDIALHRQVQPDLVTQFFISSDAQAKSSQIDLSEGVVESFDRSGRTLQVDEPLTKAAMKILLEAWPRGLSFHDLLAAAQRCVPTAAQDSHTSESFAANILTAYSAGIVDLHLYQPSWEVAPGRNPVLSPLVRRQLLAGQKVVSTLRHTNSGIYSAFGRSMLLLMDGTRNERQLADELERQISTGELVPPPGTPRSNLYSVVVQAVKDAKARVLLVAWDENLYGSN